MPTSRATPSLDLSLRQLPLAMLLCSLATLACAQTQADRNEAARQAEIIQRQNQERLLREQNEALRAGQGGLGADTRALVPQMPQAGASVGCHPVYKVVLNGAPHLSAALRERLQQYAGQCLGVSDIEQILGLITQDYVLRGYVTARAYLPSQDLSSGVLNLLVIEGTVEQLRLDDGGAGSIYLPNALPTRAGEVLNLRDLEQGIEQINRLPSNNASFDIEPGREAGGSVVVIHNQPKKTWRLSASADNQGSESTGQNQMGLTLSTDHWLGLNESLVYTHRQSQPYDEQGKGSVSDSLNWAVPLGYSTLSGSWSGSSYVSTLNAPSGLQLRSNGMSHSQSFKLDRLLYRDQAVRLGFNTGVTFKRADNYLAGQLLEVSSRRLTVLDTGLNLTSTVWGGSLSVDMGLSQGMKWGHALLDAPGLTATSPRAQFNKQVYGVNYARSFEWLSQSFSYSAQVSGQHAGTTLYGSEQFSIGGIYSVRGFNKNTLSGDHGFYWRNELSLRPAPIPGREPFDGRIYLAVDTGVVDNRVANIPQGRLTGMALGISGNYKGVGFELFNARPLRAPSFMTKESAQTWVRLSYAI